MRPGVEINSRAARAPRGEVTETGRLFFAAFTERGPSNEAVAIRSLDDFIATFGERVAFGLGYDTADVFFAEGGGEAIVARVVGPAPVLASIMLQDRAGAPLPTLRIDAVSAGDWANGAAGGLRVDVENGTVADTFRIIVELDGVEVERFDNLTMDGAADRYAPTILATSDFIRGVDQNSGTPAPNDNPALVANQNLAGGTDDHVNAVDAQWLDALDLFARDLGPGQVAAPGRSTAASHAQLIAHARANNRTALLDSVDVADRATLLAAVEVDAAVADVDRSGFFGSWFDAPAPEAGGATRAIPGSVVAAGLAARLDAERGVAGFAPAGDRGVCRYCTDVRSPAVPLSDDDITELTEAGVNMGRVFRTRGVQLYGFRTPSADPEWQQLTWQRERMALEAEANDIALGFVFENVDRQGHTFARLNGALVGMCDRHYAAGVLYGETPQDAFRVDTSDAVNTPVTIGNGEIRAAIFARFSPFGELVRIDITKVPLTASV